MDKDSLINCNWYPYEEICHLRKFSNLLWIQNQKDLAKKAAHKHDYYFTYRMLQHHFTIRKGICGIFPGKDIKTLREDEDNWLREHPEIKKISEERKEILRKQVARINKGSNPV